jgi:hypothetical protein
MFPATVFGSFGTDTVSFGDNKKDWFSFKADGAAADLVNSPAHYTTGSIECIDAIEASLTKEAFRGYLKGNIEKYVWRYETKGNPKQDLEKAQWYLKNLISTYDTITFS